MKREPRSIATLHKVSTREERLLEASGGDREHAKRVARVVDGAAGAEERELRPRGRLSLEEAIEAQESRARARARLSLPTPTVADDDKVSTREERLLEASGGDREHAKRVARVVDGAAGAEERELRPRGRLSLEEAIEAQESRARARARLSLPASTVADDDELELPAGILLELPYRPRPRWVVSAGWLAYVAVLGLVVWAILIAGLVVVWAIVSELL